MAENKNSFIIYTDWKQDFEFLTDAEAGKLIKHLLQFASDENPSLENEERLLQYAAQKMKAVMKKDLKKYEAVVQKRSEAGKKGGINSGKSRTSKQNEANEAIASNPKQNERVNDNVNVNDILLEKESKYDDDMRGENFEEIEKAKSFLKEKKQIQMDRLAMKYKLSPEQLHLKIDEFIEKKFDWEENTWKDENEMAKNFEFWLDKNRTVIINPYKTWNEKDFKAECEKHKKEFGAKTLTDFFRYWNQPTETGVMRFQEKTAWDTEQQLKIWRSNGK